MNKKPPYNYGTMSSTNEDEVGFSGQIQSHQFNSLRDNVDTNLFTIHSSFKILDNALKTIGTAKDNQALRNTVHTKQLSINQIIGVTTKDIQKLKQLVVKGDKSQKLQVEKLEENFKEAITKYYELQKSVAQKQKNHLLVPPRNEHYEDDDDEGNQQGQEQISRNLEFEAEMLVEREERIKKIEGDVLDINQIMRELASLVNTQGEVIDTIEGSIDHAAGNIEEGARSIVEASRWQTKYRKKLLFLVIIGLIVVGIIIGILVSQLKKK